MKVISIVAAFFLVPGILGAAFALLAILGELSNPEDTLGMKLAYSCGVLFFPAIFLGLGGLLLWAGLKNQRLQAGAKTDSKFAKPTDTSVS